MFSVRSVLIATAMAYILSSQQIAAFDNTWFFTPTEIDHAFHYQLRYGARLRHPLKASDCAYGHAHFVASYRLRQFTAPCKFITETTRQLKELLESGAARYLFPLDADHAHLGIPEALWQEKYTKLETSEILPLLLHEPSLVALYHTAEHLDPNRQVKGSTEKDWGANRTVIGFFDGRHNVIMPPLADGSASYEPKGFRWFGGFTFLAQSLGELQLVAMHSAMPFDISFEDDLAADSSLGGTLNISTQGK